MFSRAVLAFFLLLSSLGCVKFNQAPPPKAPPNLNVGEQAQCLSAKLPVMKQFIDGTASRKDLADTWDCISVAMTIYREFVRGQSNDYYLPREIANFFELYFLKDVQVTDELLVQLMKIKVVIVGGSDSRFTLNEIGVLIDAIETFKSASLQILPYMKIFSFNWLRTDHEHFSKDFAYFEEANQNIQAVAKQIAALVTKNQKSYDLANIKPLIIEFAHVAKADWSLLHTIDQYLPLVYNLKNTLTGGSGELVNANDWQPFLNLGARGYTQFLRFYYFVSNSDSPGGSAELVFLAKALDDILSFLVDMISNKPSHQLTRAELLTDLTSFSAIFPSFKMSDELLAEAMKIKSVIFGGDISFFNIEDFARARGKVEIIRKLLERVYLYLPIYTAEWDPTIGDRAGNLKYFLESGENLKEICSQVASIVENSYDLLDLAAFFKELNKLYPTGGKLKGLANLDKYIPAVIGVKQALFSDDNSSLTKEQWPQFLQVTGKVAARFLQYYYFVSLEKDSKSTGLGLMGMNSFVQESLLSIDEVISMKPGGRFANQDLAKILNGLVTSGFLSVGFTPEVVNSLLFALTNRILLSPEDRLLNKIQDSALTAKGTALLRVEWLDYYKIQKFYSDQVFSSASALVGRQELHDDFVNAASLDSTVQGEMAAVFSTPIGRPVDDQDRMYIGYDDKAYSLKGMFWQTFGRTFARLLIRSYSNDLSRINNYQGITVDEWTTAVNDLKPVIIGAGLIDTVSSSFAKSRFLEANLFTPRSNGDNYASFVEISDFVLNLFSGIALNGLVNKKLTVETDFGCQLVPTPNSSALHVSASCLTEVYHKNFAEIFTSMPYASTWVLGLKRCEKISQFPWLLDSNSFNNATPQQLAAVGESDLPGYLGNCGMSFDALMVYAYFASGYAPEYSGMMKLTEVNLVTHVLQYVESVMQRFDANHSGFIVTSEVDVAYPIFKTVLQSVSGLNDDTLLKGLLAYFLVNGKPPESTLEQISFFFFSYSPNSWDIHAPRMTFAEVLGYIANAIRSAGAIAKPKLPTAPRITYPEPSTNAGIPFGAPPGYSP